MAANMIQVTCPEGSLFESLNTRILYGLYLKGMGNFSTRLPSLDLG